MSRLESQEHATDCAWRIHDALMDWTGKVDGKATFALSLETAAVTVLAALSTHRLPLPGGRPPGVLALCYWTGVGLLLLSVAISVCVVLPRLGRAMSREQWRDGFIYFGHLRHWDPVELAEALLTREPLAVLTRQLVDMSRICWRKHRLVQTSIVLASVGIVMSAVSCMLT